MAGDYLPPSDFLRMAAAGDVPFTVGAPADANLDRLLAMTADDDSTNRDWATLLVAQLPFDTPAVRQALAAAASDPDQAVRSEAILGLAARDPTAALPLVVAALTGVSVTVPVLEAAALLADLSLAPGLLPFCAPSGDALLDQLAQAALTACGGGRPAGR